MSPKEARKEEVERKAAEKVEVVVLRAQTVASLWPSMAVAIEEMIAALATTLPPLPPTRRIIRSTPKLGSSTRTVTTKVVTTKVVKAERAKEKEGVKEKEKEKVKVKEKEKEKVKGRKEKAKAKVSGKGEARPCNRSPAKKKN